MEIIRCRLCLHHLVETKVGVMSFVANDSEHCSIDDANSQIVALAKDDVLCHLCVANDKAKLNSLFHEFSEKFDEFLLPLEYQNWRAYTTPKEENLVKCNHDEIKSLKNLDSESKEKEAKDTATFKSTIAADFLKEQCNGVHLEENVDSKFSQRDKDYFNDLAAKFKKLERVQCTYCNAYVPLLFLREHARDVHRRPPSRQSHPIGRPNNFHERPRLETIYEEEDEKVEEQDRVPGKSLKEHARDAHRLPPTRGLPIRNPKLYQRPRLEKIEEEEEKVEKHDRFNSDHFYKTSSRLTNSVST